MVETPIYDYGRLRARHDRVRPERHPHADHDHRRAERANGADGPPPQSRAWSAAMMDVDPDHLRNHPAPTVPHDRGGGHHAEAGFRQRHDQRGPRPHGVALYPRRRTADGRRRLSAPSHQRGRSLQGDHPPLRSDEIAQGDIYLLNDPYTAALHTSDVYLVSPIHYRRRAGRLVRLLRACQRYRRDQSGRFLAAGARHFLGRLFVARAQDRCRRAGSAATCSIRSSTWSVRRTWSRSTSAR